MIKTNALLRVTEAANTLSEIGAHDPTNDGENMSKPIKRDKITSTSNQTQNNKRISNKYRNKYDNDNGTEWLRKSK